MRAGAHCRSLHGKPGQVGCAPPDFLLRFMALMHFMRLSLRKGAHAALSSAAWQEIRVGMTKGRAALPWRAVAEERRMKFANATNLHRKSGAA